MANPAAGVDAAERAIQRAIQVHREPMRRIFASLQPLEAIALLGFLIGETIERFPPDQRAETLAALYDALQEPPP